jgi:hypothetical protein
MNEQKKRGGARPNSGRLKKDEVISLIESMDAIAVPDTVWKMLYAKVLDSDVNAIKLWLNYRYGLPKQTIEQKTSITSENIDWAKYFDEDK